MVAIAPAAGVTSILRQTAPSSVSWFHMRPPAPLHLTRLAARCPFAALAIVCAFASAAPAQNLWSAASDNSLWIVRAQTSAGSVAIYFHLPTDPPDQLRPLLSLSGRLAPPGIAATPQHLWLVFSNGSVTSLSLPLIVATRPPRAEPYVVAPLPRDLEITSLAACRTGLWALAHPSDESLPPMQQLDEAEHTLEDSPAARPSPTLSPSRTSPRKSSPATRLPQQPAIHPQTAPHLQLLHLAQSDWVASPLPPECPAAPLHAQLISDPQQDRPSFIVQDPQHEITIFTPQTADPAAWSATPLGTTALESWRAVAVRRQIVIAERRTEIPNLGVRLWLARPSGLTTLATLDFPDLPAASPWTISALSDRVALVASHNNRLYWSTCDLTGRQTLAAQPLFIQTPPSWINQPDIVVVTLVLVTASLLVVYILVRRASGTARVPPPAAPAFPLASLAARALAALIDFVPCFALVYVLFPHAMSKPTFEYWPGRSGTWPAMLPGLLVIALFVTHTTLAEWRFGCSFGKRILRLRVLDVSTLRPQAWQILLRNLLKILDLIVPPLLVILVVSPYRQRLGDIVAYTIVASTNGSKPESDTTPGPNDDAS